LYEIITGDEQFVRIPHHERTIALMQDIAEWPCNRKLDADVSVFRNFLNEWVAKRSASDDMERYLDAPHRLDWPDMPTAPDYDVPFESERNQEGEVIGRMGPRYKRNARATGQYIFNWERPLQSRLKKTSDSPDTSEI
jgi:hypothetical protein